MALFTGTQQQYYNNSQSFTGDGSDVTFTLTFNPLPTAETEFNVYIDTLQQNSNTYAYNAGTGVLTFTTAPADGATILVQQNTFDENLGNYQFVLFRHLVNNFMISYVGEDKIISKLKRTDVYFHAQRALQELSYDTFKSTKAQEVELPASLSIKMPHDYVNYVKLSYKDGDGIEHLLHNIKDSSNPSAILQDSDAGYTFDATGTLLYASKSDTFSAFDNTTVQTDDDDVEYPELTSLGHRYGLDPSTAQRNGWFYVDQNQGKFNFSSNLSGKTITIKYISDSLATEDEMKVHKLAEEAVYKYIAHAVLSTRANVPEYLVARFKREKFAAVRQAKLRLSNLKSELIAQVMRGKSKWIKH